MKVFIGAAPGIGKLEALLESAVGAAREKAHIVWGEDVQAPLPAGPWKGEKGWPFPAGQEPLHTEEQLQALLTTKPDIVLLSHLFRADLSTENANKRLSLIRLLENSGITVYTTLNIHEVESIAEHLLPEMQFPTERAIPIQFLTEVVRDFEVVDKTPRDIMRKYKRRNYGMRMAAAGLQHSDSFTDPEVLVLLREAMFELVGAHVTRQAGQSNVFAGQNIPAAETVHNEEPLYTFRELLFQGAIGFGWVSVATVLSWGLVIFAELPPASAGLILLCGVMLAALNTSLPIAIICALIAFASYNFMLVWPHWLFDVNTLGDALTLAVFVITGILVAEVAGRRRDREVRFSRSFKRQKSMFKLSRALSTAGTLIDCAEAAAKGLEEVLGVKAHILVPNSKKQLYPAYPLNIRLDNEMLAAATRTLNSHRVAKLIMQDASRLSYYPLLTNSGAAGVVGITETKKNLEAQTNPLQYSNFLRSYLEQVAVAIDRVQLAEQVTEAVVKSERESLRSALLSSISHDLKSPLVTIIGALSSLKVLDMHLKPEDRAELVDSAREEAERLNQIITNILEMTKLESGAVVPKCSWLDLPEIVADAINRIQKRDQGITFVRDFQENLPQIYVDEVLLAQVFFNLFDNARKYAGSSATVSIRAFKSTKSKKVIIDVTDNGPGIEPDKMEKIFDKFFRPSQKDRRVAGSGLGLAICLGIMTAHGGTIRAMQSKTGVGAHFRLTLPLEPPIAMQQHNE